MTCTSITSTTMHLLFQCYFIQFESLKIQMKCFIIILFMNGGDTYICPLNPGWQCMLECRIC